MGGLGITSIGVCEIIQEEKREAKRRARKKPWSCRHFRGRQMKRIQGRKLERTRERKRRRKLRGRGAKARKPREHGHGS